MKRHPVDVLRAIVLPQATVRTMKQNLSSAVSASPSGQQHGSDTG